MQQRRRVKQIESLEHRLNEEAKRLREEANPTPGHAQRGAFEESASGRSRLPPQRVVAITRAATARIGLDS